MATELTDREKHLLEAVLIMPHPETGKTSLLSLREIEFNGWGELPVIREEAEADRNTVMVAILDEIFLLRTAADANEAIGRPMYPYWNAAADTIDVADSLFEAIAKHESGYSDLLVSMVTWGWPVAAKDLAEYIKTTRGSDVDLDAVLDGRLCSVCGRAGLRRGGVCGDPQCCQSSAA